MHGCAGDGAAVNKISIIVPVLNEAPGIEQALEALQPLRARGHELIVVDGGSRDGTTRLVGEAADQIVDAPRGRAQQMNAGARVADADVLLFLHADTRLPCEADRLVLEGLRRQGWEVARSPNTASAAIP